MADTATYTGVDGNTYQQGKGYLGAVPNTLPNTPVAPAGPVAANNASAVAAATAPQPSTQPSSPTVLSNANVLENTIPGLDAAANKLPTPAPTMLVGGSDTAAQDATDYGTAFSTALGAVPDATQDPIVKQEMELINSLRTGNDATTDSYISSIQRNYQDLAANLFERNRSTSGALEASLNRGGTARYAPNSYAGALDLKTKADISSLSDLNDQEAQKIAAVKDAQASKDYQLVDKQLSELDSIRSDKQQLAKTVADNMATTVKTNRAAVQTVLASAAKNGAPPDILNAISRASDIAGATVAAGDYLNEGDYAKYKREALAAGQTPVDANAFYAKKIGSGSSGNGIDLTQFDQATQDKLTSSGFTKYNDNVQSLAEQLVTGAMAPSELSKRATGDASYNDVLSAAKAYSQATTGKTFDIAQADRDYKFANQPNTLNTLNYLVSLTGSTDGSGNLTGGNLDELVNQSNGLTRTSFPALNNASAWTRMASGDPQIAAYYATVTEVSDQIAKILQGGGSGSGTSDAKLAQAQALFNKGFNKSQINAVVSAIKPLLANRGKSMVGDNPYLSDYADKLGIQQNNVKSGTGDTGSQLIQSEQKAQTTIKSYISSHPEKSGEIQSRIDAAEKSLGRPLTSQEFLQAYPEYGGTSFNSVGGDTKTASIPTSSRLAYVNNNPGNLRFAGQSGATPGAGGFAKFPSVAAGVQALENQIKLDQGRGLSISAFVSKFAPPSENDTNLYIKQIADRLGVRPDTQLSDIPSADLARAIAYKESSSVIS